MTSINFEDYFPSGSILPAALQGRGLGEDTYITTKNWQFTGNVTLTNQTSTGVMSLAAPNGVNDDVAINAALQTVSASSTLGVVQLSKGTYVLSAPIVMPNNVWLRGVGMFSGTKITTVAGGNFNIFDNYNNFSANNPWTKAMVSDLEIDGSNLNRTINKKGMNGHCVQDCKFFRLYIHDTTATGLGVDDYSDVTVTECVIKNCGYTNPHTITAASWSTNTFSFTTADNHGYSIGSQIIITGMVPVQYNGIYVVTTVPDATHFTIATSNNNSSASLSLSVNPGTATTFGQTSDNILGNNGIGIASGAMTAESMIITNNVCIGNQDNNFLVEADTVGTGDSASYIFANNISISAGQCGFRNTGTPNVQFVNNFDYGSLYGAFVTVTTQNLTITNASWASSVATYTTSTNHGYAVGQYVMINSINPSGYNGAFYVASVPTNTTFTVAMTNNPGSYVSGGQAQTVAHPVGSTLIADSIFTDNIWYGVNVNPQSNGVSVRNNTVKNCINYGMYIGSGSGGITGNRVHDNGIEGIWIYTGSTQYMPLDNLDIANNHVYNNGKLQANKDGISINSNANTPITNLTIRNNNVFDNQQTATQRYGILIRSGGNNSNMMVNGNSANGNTTGPIFIQDTSNTIVCFNNQGFNPIGKNAIGSKSGTVTVDSTTGSHFTVTLTGNGTFSFPTTSRTLQGTEMTLEITQDATGSRTATWPGNFKKAGGTLTLTTTANATDIVKMAYDGTNWIEVSRSLNVS